MRDPERSGREGVGRRSGDRSNLLLDVEEVVVDLVGESASEHEDRPHVASAANTGSIPLAFREVSQQRQEVAGLVLELAQRYCWVFGPVATKLGQLGERSLDGKHWTVFGEDSVDAVGEELGDVAHMGQVLQGRPDVAVGTAM